MTDVAGSCVPKYPGCDTADVYLSGSAQYWAACNVGAEYAWTGGLAVTDCAGGSSDCDAGIRNTLGSYFQWGRNTDATTLTGAA
ncbi:MAG: hypothetical protein QG650_786 [Patescibacteria group bacterium]|nr:hypothetical protein [Patescibacteria group bacterium]